MTYSDQWGNVVHDDAVYPHLLHQSLYSNNRTNGHLPFNNSKKAP